MKKLKFILAATAALLLMAVVFQYGCKKAGLEQTNSDYEQLIAAQDYSNNELVRLIKLTDPPLSDRELMGIMIAASPLNDNIIKELLKRGQPPCRCALSDETLQMILLFNLPLSDHILKEMEKAGIELDRNLLDNINLDDLPDMELEKANLLMETLLNIKFGCGECEFQLIELVRDTVEVYGTLESGRYFVLAQEFITSLEDMNLRCNGASDEVTRPCISKHVRAVDLDIITSLDPDGSKVFKVAFTPVVALVVQAPPVIIDCNYPFPGQAWKWGNLLGECVSPTTATDAAEKIEMAANRCDLLIAYCQVGSFFNVNIISDNATGPPATLVWNDPSGVFGDQICDYAMFHSSMITNPNTFDDCLSTVTILQPPWSVNELNEHERGTRFMGALLAGQLPPPQPSVPPTGFEIVSYNLQWYEQGAGPSYQIGHEVSVVYAQCQGAIFL